MWFLEHKNQRDFKSTKIDVIFRAQKSTQILCDIIHWVFKTHRKNQADGSIHKLGHDANNTIAHAWRFPKKHTQNSMVYIVTVLWRSVAVVLLNWVSNFAF